MTNNTDKTLTDKLKRYSFKEIVPQKYTWQHQPFCLSTDVNRLEQKLTQANELIKDLRDACRQKQEELDCNKSLVGDLLKANEQLEQANALLDEIEEYFDQRADADCDQDGFIPNEEMKLLRMIQARKE